jgi:hypothetical protein
MTDQPLVFKGDFAPDFAWAPTHSFDGRAARRLDPVSLQQPPYPPRPYLLFIFDTECCVCKRVAISALWSQCLVWQQAQRTTTTSAPAVIAVARDSTSEALDSFVTPDKPSFKGSVSGESLHAQGSRTGRPHGGGAFENRTRDGEPLQDCGLLQIAADPDRVIFNLFADLLVPRYIMVGEDGVVRTHCTGFGKGTWSDCIQSYEQCWLEQEEMYSD